MTLLGDPHVNGVTTVQTAACVSIVVHATLQSALTLPTSMIEGFIAKSIIVLATLHVPTRV